MKVEFEPDGHKYKLDGTPVPSVTTVIKAILPYPSCDPWYLERGQAVHACAALLAQDKLFAHDPQIAGQVEACRRFFADVKPDVLAVEHKCGSARHQYAGTLDLLAMIGPHMCIIDYKASPSGRDIYQCAAYGLAVREAGRWLPRYGVTVELRDDGRYTMSPLRLLRSYEAEWLAMLRSYRIQREVLGK